MIAKLFSRIVLGPMTERIKRWTPQDEKLRIVADRINVEWRQSTTPQRRPVPALTR